MSGINFNDTDKQPLTTLDNAAVIAKTLTGFASAPGTVGSGDSILSAINKLDGNIAVSTAPIVTTAALAANYTVTTAYNNVPGGGMAQVSTVQLVVTTIANERVQLTWNGNVLLGAVGELCVGYQVDSDTAVVCTYVGARGAGNASCDFSETTAALSAGSHTIKLVACYGTTANPVITGTANYIDSNFTATQYRALGSTGGTMVTASNLAANFTITSTNPTYQQVSAVQCTFTAIANEQVQLSFCGGVIQSTAGAGAFGSMGYSIDGATTVPVATIFTNGQWFQTPVEFCVMTAPLTAGSHTIRLMVFGSAVATLIVYGGTTASYPESTFRVTQYRATATTGAVVSDWTSFTPTGAWTTNVTYTGFYKRVGDSLDVRIKILCSGAPDAGNLTVNLPAGFTIDTAKMVDTTAFDALVGDCSILDTGIIRYGQGHVGYYNSTSVVVLYPVLSTTLVTQNPITKTAPFTFGNTDKVFINFKVPIV